MKPTYKIVVRGSERCVYLSDDPPQYLTRADMDRWMIEIHDTDYDLYAKLVPVYVQLTLPGHRHSRKLCEIKDV